MVKRWGGRAVGQIPTALPYFEKMKFKVIVAAFNFENWIEKCLSSIQRQTSENFDCLVIDDASKDATFQIAADTIKNDERFKILKHEKNVGVYTKILAIRKCNAENQDVIVIIDGDDWLAHDKVFERVRQEYENGAWATYGQDQDLKGDRGFSEPIPEEIIAKQAYRQYHWASAHLKTFKYFLFKQIRDDAFRDRKGRPFRAAMDLALMFPILELGGERVHFISDILYVYNRGDKGSSDAAGEKFDTRDGAISRECEMQIRTKEKYLLIRSE